MVSKEALKKLQEQSMAWPMTQRFVVQQLIEDYRRNQEDLRAYEATGLTPEQYENAKVIIEAAFSDDTSKAERIQELLKADKDGRLVVLPCKVGDTIYHVRCNTCHARGGAVGGRVMNDPWTRCTQLPDWATTDNALEAKAIEAWNRRATNG